MRVNPKSKTISIGQGRLKFSLLQSGKIEKINFENKMINQLRMTDQEDMFSNIYLRLKTNDSFEFIKVIGSSKTSYDQNHIYYEGNFKDVDYLVTIHVLDQMWFIDVELSGNSELVDVYYVQDIGIKHEGGIRNNEAYNSQYIDHKVFEQPYGYSICSKQNQGNDEYLQIGSLSKTIGYATDGYQFFGLDYKFESTPKALKDEKLPNEIYQYEFSCAALQTDSICLGQNNSKVTFYGYFEPYHQGSIKNLEFFDVINETYKTNNFEEDRRIYLDEYVQNIDFKNIYTSPKLSENELNILYQERKFEEYQDGQLLSFFGEKEEHIVLESKERLVERLHGHIILNGHNNYIKEETLASTSFISGVFNSQLVLGNTSFHKFISNTRNMLNIQRSNGQRIFVKINNEYKLLGMPALYEMGFNYSKWLYKINDDILEVVSFTSYDHNQVNLRIKSYLGHKYQMLITTQVVMGSEELEHDYEVNKTDFGYQFRAVDGTMFKNNFNNAAFNINISGNEIKKDLNDMIVDSLFVNEAYDSIICMSMSGYLENEKTVIKLDFEEEKQKFFDAYKNNINDFKLSIDKNHPRYEEVEKYNTIMYWYTHDALIHFQSPHGLEQFGGAAWGTRDVCQGPFEYFLSLGKYNEAKTILLEVYRHQFIDNGDWPQWFMFDKYFHIQAKESHGDIIVWPLRSVALYLEATKDLDILDEKLSYTILDNSEYTKNTYTLLDHMKKAIEHIITHYIKDTHLSSYGDGDWDDTLQPANPELRKSMVSGWTTALTFETFKLLSDLVKEKDEQLSKLLKEETQFIQKDYQTYVIKDEVPAGFLHFGNQGIRYIIHPTDDVTHMKYRLLPMNRGLISQLFNKEQAQKMYETIKENLYHPDGVRLMDKTVAYHGGENTYFKRAETSANFGREIGLQYVHAHIRFVEAMAKLGKTDEVWNGLLKINPIKIKESVKNAAHRQANAYFSSSDGAFLNRYEAMKDFSKLFTGHIEVKGGWRVYSSGPGIYVHQVVAKLLGVSTSGKYLQLDPQIPNDLSGLSFNYTYEGKKLTLVYHLNQGSQKVLINGLEAPFTVSENLYRNGSILIEKTLLNQASEITLEYFS